ncbi:anthranilate synthase component I family protein [Psychrobacter piscatorii]|uniref:anthranilate synthase component I family protein n=1 Tax=Psychrobacter piscatorii TaxID=554343 RepID=UPI00191B5027|nr:anthranilate synthase component I family protein [Psychrobacter piscatorii]
MVAPNQTITEQTDSAPSPASKSSWRFGDVSAAELMPQLRRHLLNQDDAANWQLAWLNNDGRPVIGLLPKVSWSVYAADQKPFKDSNPVYRVVKNCRDNCSTHSENTTTAYMSYLEWQNELIAYSKAYDTDSNSSNNINSKNTKPNYHHGLIGFISYDIAAYELSPADRIELANQPCASLGHYDIYLTPAADTDTDWELKSIQTNSSSNEAIGNKVKDEFIVTLTSYLDELDKKLSDKYLNQAQSKRTSHTIPVVLKARWSKRDYQQAFDRTQDYLQQGDCYQINLTQKWSGYLPYKNDATQPTSALIDYLPSLHHNTQAPFAGYLSVDGASVEHVDALNNSFELLSCSPELFFTFTRDKANNKHHILTKPIKGTMPRGTTDKQDESYKQQLVDSEKDRAENVMIVDLLRNDLGKYAKIGSVKVPQLFAIESFSNVHHMVSTITAELKIDTHPLAVLFGSLPAGSITGTPKKRAVEIIAELESTPRGAYCGTMGYMNFDGSGQWNVLIRTLQANALSHNESVKERQINLWAGGGITVASDCDAEYQECLDKVGNLLAVLAKKV